MIKNVIAISGGFDPVHIGHVKMVEEASKLGGVLVILNSDKWLMRKKGYVFMPWKERAYIMGNIKGVVAVTNVDDSDNTVCQALKRHRPGTFANGGDRKDNNVPEVALCEELGIEMIWNIGGGKIQSSSDLVKKRRQNGSKI